MAEAVATETRSFAKGLFAGRFEEDLVFPFPKMQEEERQRLGALLADFRRFAAESIDDEKMDEEETIAPEVRKGLGKLGLYGLYLPPELGGQGFSATAYCRMFEDISRVSPSLAVHLGAHQSIGYKGIALFGNDEQKRRYLPKLASGEWVASFGLTEREAGSDVAGLKTRAVPDGDDAYVLDGEKIWIGNAGISSVFTVFAKTPVDVDGQTKDRVTAFVVERGTPGFSTGPEFKKLGIRGASLAPLRFERCRVPAANVLGEPGDGFKQAMQILNNGRLSLAAGSVGGAKELLRLSTAHAKSRVQFGQPIAEFGMVKEKIGWMSLHTWAVESMVYLTTGLVDAGIEDYALESAMCKVAASEFYWYAVNRAFQLRGGGAYIRPNPFERALRDARINNIFEGANDVLRAFIALSGMKPVADSLTLVGDALKEPIAQIGTITDYFLDRLYRTFVSEKLTRGHPSLAREAGFVEEGTRALEAACERILKRHGREVARKQFAQKRLAHVAMDLYAMVATISRATTAIADKGPQAGGRDRLLCQLFCERAHRRVLGLIRAMDDNDDEDLKALADEAYAADGRIPELFGV
jgi:acyl-CoA dehydrogenase family protein 9